MLRMAIEEEDPDSNPPTRWHAISQHIPNRTNKDCRKRWWAQMATVVSKGSWTSDEDERLCRAVDELGPKWALVASRVRTRNSGQCAKRWNDALNPSIDRSGWSQEDDEQLLRAVEEQGHCWANIARTSLPGRTGLAAKNRYNHLMRGACRQAGKRQRRPSAVSAIRRRSRGSSASSIGSASQWSDVTSGSTSSSDSSDCGTMPSTPGSYIEGDEMPLFVNGSIADKTLIGDAQTTLSSLYPGSPTLPADMEQHFVNMLFADALSPHQPDLIPSPSLFCDASSSLSLPYQYDSSFDVLSDIDALVMWSPCASAACATDMAFLTPNLDTAQRPSELCEPFTQKQAPSVHSPSAEGSPVAADYLTAYSLAPEHAPLDSVYPERGLPSPDIPPGAQLTVKAIAEFPDKASVQLTHPTSDGSDRRVAVAVAICDQDDIMSTVRTLSQSLSTMLVQGQSCDSEQGQFISTPADPAAAIWKM
ncbi:hypothetical protein WOLCODRAFT_107457 [Wolfiporia cocos MD-104 SS10]|uniref:Uncharacterized protein n=1 Tax=Wolfiporia cocos (strain MD-104) TaxID=742152 RepID=A0A2H3JCW9_WOLCO|nr:hypothetical protein WOLCODRAFT_107457 [Wolfiporia cocos MD-104 SS10]